MDGGEREELPNRPKNLWQQKFSIKCPKCGRTGTLSLKIAQLCGKKECTRLHRGLYPRVIHTEPRKECYLSKRLIATGGILPHLLRKKRRALEFRLKHSLPLRNWDRQVRKRSGARAQLQQLQMPTQPTLTFQTEPPRNPETKRVEEQPTATFERDGNYITVRRPPEPPVVVLIARTGELYCGGCAKTNCAHTEATRQWLRADGR